MRGGFEVTLLVEDVVEGEQHLLLEEGDAAAGEESGNVAGVLAGGGISVDDEGGSAENGWAGGGVGRDLVEGLAGAGEKRRFFEEVGGG